MKEYIEDRMPPKRPQSGAGGTSSKYKVAPESTKQPPSRPRSSRNQVAPDASQSASSQQASPSGIELVPRTSSGRRIAWSASSATAFAPPEVRDELNGFKERLTGLTGDLQRKIASGVPAAKWAQIQKMLSPEARLPAKPEYAEFITRLQTLLAAPTTNRIRNATYEALRTFADEHGLDPKHRLNSFRALLNFIDTRRRRIAKINTVQFEELDEDDQTRYTDIDHYRSEKSKTTPTILLTILHLFGNPELTLLAKVYIQEALADLYAHTTDYLQGAYYRRHDIWPFVQFAFHLHEHLRIVRAARPQTETTTAYAAFLEDLQGDLVPRLDAAWDILVAFFEAPGTHPNPRARTHWIKETLLASFSNYMGLTEAHQATFQSFMETYFLHSPTTMPRVYRVVIHLYNKTYHAPLRDFAFSVLERMVALAETKLPKTSVHLRIFTIIRPFYGFFDEYYGTKYEDGDRHGKHYTRNFKEILGLLTASLLLEKRETQASQLATKKAFLKKKVAWFNKHYKAYLSIPLRD